MHEMVKESQRSIHSVRPPPPPFAGGGEGRLNLQPSFQKGGLDRTSTFREGDFFTGGCNFKKRKSEIFNGKKSL